LKNLAIYLNAIEQTVQYPPVNLKKKTKLQKAIFLVAILQQQQQTIRNMGPTTPKSKAAANAKPPPPFASPRKKQGKRPPMKELKSSPGTAGRFPTLSCHAFVSLLPIEAYLYTKDDHNDGFTNGLRKFFNGVTESPELTEIDLRFMKDRRIPNSDNLTLKDSNNWPRKIIIRIFEDRAQISTPETRQQGLSVIKTFLLSRSNSDFPPTDITTMDLTDEQDPPALDMFLLDQDIETIIKQEFREEDLNEDFYTDYPDLARKLWGGNHYNDFARSLGFP
jgi:hypothetical protein